MKARPAPPPASRPPSGFARWRVPVIAVSLLIVVAGIGFLVWSQKKAQHYEEAYKKGEKLWTERQPEPALAALRAAAKIDPDDPGLWLLIGRCEYVLRQPDRAVQAWQEALKRDPAFAPALFERGREAFVRHVAGRMPPPVDPATKWLPQALAPAGGGDEVTRIMADFRAGSGCSPEAARFAKGAFDLLEGRYRDAYAGLQAYADSTVWDEAGPALAGIAALFAALPDRAEKALSQALLLRPDNPRLQLRAQARYLQGNYEGARADYRDAGVEKEAEPLFATRIPMQGCILWLRADAGVDVTGSSVSAWHDQSPKHHDAIPKESDPGPTLNPSAVRGRPAIGFAGTKDGLKLPDDFDDLGAGLSLFVVGEPQTDAGEPWSFILLATPASGAGMDEAFIGRRRQYDQIVYASETLKSGPQRVVPGVDPAKGADIFGAIHETSEKFRFYKRGQVVGTGTLPVPRKTKRTRNRVGPGFTGPVAEILVYNRPLTELERLGVEVYLEDRYFPAAKGAEAAEKR